MRIPIRYQFMLPLLVVALASLLAVGLINWKLATRHTKSRIESQLQGVVAVLTESNYPLTGPVLRQMGGLANADFVLTDAEGQLLASGSSASVKSLPVSSSVAKTVAEISLGPEIALGDKSFLHSALWVHRRPDAVGPKVLHILFAKAEFDAAWRAAFVPPLLVGVLTIVAVALVTHLVAGRVSKVLSRLGQEVGRLAEGDFTELQQPAWDDETKDLTSAVNQTASRLSEYEAELRQTERVRTVSMLGAGLAHEMRNAATGCRLAVDLHAEGCTANHSDDSLEVARRQLQLMENRLQQLLRLGKQSVATEEELVDLSQLVSESVALIQPAARHAGIKFQWQQPEVNIVVNGDAELLGQAVMNLLLNALEAATKNQVSEHRSGFVDVELNCQGDESELIIADSGVGFSGNVADTVFEPFVTDKPEGVGLGLAVAKRVVESSGGQIGWSRSSGVTKFSIHLPLAAAEVLHV